MADRPPKPIRSIEDLWQEFAAAVSIPLGGTQWQEMRRAFYAGTVALLSELRRFEGDEDSGVKLLCGFQDQQREFYARIAKGKA